jgi:hypothetical protein
MEISFNPAVEATLQRIAKETGRGPEQVVVDLEVGEGMQRILRP